MLRLLLVTAILAISSLGIFAQDTANKCIDDKNIYLSLSETGQAAYDGLRDARIFEAGPVGFRGRMSQQIKNLGLLMQERERVAALNTILEKGTSAGKLYALSGLYFADRGSFEIGRMNLRDSEETVQVLNGCIMMDLPLGKIVEADEANVAIIKPGQTMQDFWSTNTGGYELDIAHGGYPTIFKEAAESKVKMIKD